MELSRYLRQHARTIPGKSQLFINSYAKALEVIPRQLCDNAGFDATDVLNKLRQKHAIPSGIQNHFYSLFKYVLPIFLEIVVS
jgi:T-complex protein 1 subunit eta